jgi:hypothetical protein
LLALLSVPDADVEIFFDTVDILPWGEGRVGCLVVDQLAGVRRGPVLHTRQAFIHKYLIFKMPASMFSTLSRLSEI